VGTTNGDNGHASTRRALETRHALLEGIPTEGHRKGKHLQETYSLSSGELREAIHLLRVEGHPIGSNNEGYFLASPERVEEYERSIANMRRRAISTFLAARGMRRSRVAMEQAEL